jgi:hypothetical protein
MTSIATYVVVVVVPLVVVYVAFSALVRGVPKGTGYEVEVKLFPPSIRRRVDATDTRPPDPDAVPEIPVIPVSEDGMNEVKRICIFPARMTRTRRGGKKVPK